MKNIFLIILLITFLVSCSETNEPSVENEFSIYLLKDTPNNFPNEVSLNNLVLEEEPVISIDDVISYTWNSHEIEYSDIAKEKLKLKEPLYGSYFVVVANHQRIYWGLFTFDISSGRCDNPVINLPSTHAMTQSYIKNSFVIDRAYPKYFGDENDPDIRENEVIYKMLKNSGKLN